MQIAMVASYRFHLIYDTYRNMYLYIKVNLWWVYEILNGTFLDGPHWNEILITHWISFKSNWNSPNVTYAHMFREPAETQGARTTRTKWGKWNTVTPLEPCNNVNNYGIQFTFSIEYSMFQKSVWRIQEMTHQNVIFNIPMNFVGNWWLMVECNNAFPLKTPAT